MTSEPRRREALTKPKVTMESLPYEIRQVIFKDVDSFYETNGNANWGPTDVRKLLRIPWVRALRPLPISYRQAVLWVLENRVFRILRRTQWRYWPTDDVFASKIRKVFLRPDISPGTAISDEAQWYMKTFPHRNNVREVTLACNTYAPARKFRQSCHKSSYGPRSIEGMHQLALEFPHLLAVFPQLTRAYVILHWIIPSHHVSDVTLRLRIATLLRDTDVEWCSEQIGIKPIIHSCRELSRQPGHVEAHLEWVFDGKNLMDWSKVTTREYISTEPT